MNETPIRHHEDFVDWDREEDEACQAGTVGCCIDHTAARDAGRPQGCETW